MRLFFLLGRRNAVDLLDLSDGHDVLEISAGTGHNLPLIASRISGGTLACLTSLFRCCNKPD